MFGYKFYREDLEKKKGFGMMAHEKLTKPRVIIDLPPSKTKFSQISLLS